MIMYVFQFDAIATTPSGVSAMDRWLVANRTRQFLTGISKGHRRLEGERTVDIFAGFQLPVYDHTKTLYCLPWFWVVQRSRAATVLINHDHHGR